jgi:CRISPR-associated protein Cas5h
MPDKFLIFDIWGDYAHFKKFYTTSSPLTFSIPPRTAIIGLISAIIGIDKDEYLDIMTKDKAKIAVRIINPIKKIRMTQNLINTKDDYWVPVKRGTHEPRTQIRFEYLKDPRFRIYFQHVDTEIYESLKQNLKNHKSVYTPCLGTSELIADFMFISESTILEELNSNEFLDIHSVIPLDKEIKINFESGKKYFKERIPIEMKPGRIVTEYKEVLYEIEGKTINAMIKSAIKLSNGDVIAIS